MKKQDKISLYLLAVAFLFVGVMLGLDLFEIAVFGLRGCWVGILLVLIALAFMVGGIIARSREFIFTPIVCAVIGIMLLLISFTNKGIGDLWPMIPLAIFLALGISSMLRSRYKIFIETGIWGTAISVACLVGTLFSLWTIVFPTLLVLVGAIISAVMLFISNQIPAAVIAAVCGFVAVVILSSVADSVRKRNREVFGLDEKFRKKNK